MVSVSTLQLSFREVSCVGFCVLTLSDGNIHNYFGNTTKMFFPFSAMYQGQTVSCTSTKHIIADWKQLR